MNLTDFQALWISTTSDPQVLYATRIGIVVPLVVLAALKLWEFIDPLHRHPLMPAQEKGIWRALSLLVAVLALFCATYYCVMSAVEPERLNTLIRSIYFNVAQALLFWVLCLTTMKRRKESWERKYLAGHSAPVVPVTVL